MSAPAGAVTRMISPGQARFGVLSQHSAVPGRAAIAPNGQVATTLGSRSPLPSVEQGSAWRDHVAEKHAIPREQLEGVWPVEAGQGGNAFIGSLVRSRLGSFYDGRAGTGWSRFSAITVPIEILKSAPGIGQVIRKYTTRKKEPQAGITLAQSARQLRRLDPQILAAAVERVPHTNVKKLYQQRLQRAIEAELAAYRGV